MKKIILGLFACAAIFNAGASTRAFYIKKGDTYYKYNFGITDGLLFSNEGKTLQVVGYDEVIDMTGVDHIYFDAPIDEAALTPAAQKEKLVKVGDEVNSLIDLNKVSDLLNMYHRFFDHIDGQCPPSEYEVPEEYYDIHKSVKGLVKAASEVAGGNPAAIRRLGTRAADLYRVEDYFGVYVANRETESWTRTSIPDYFEMQYYSGSNIRYFVRLEASKDYSTWTTKDFDGRLPKTMTVTFGQGDNVFATLVITSNLVQDKSIDMNIVFNASDYSVRNTLKAVNDNLTDDVFVTVGGKEVVASHAVVEGKNLVTYDTMFDAIKESTHYHDDNGDCCGEDPTELIAHFTRASSKTDVLGQLQVFGKGVSFSKLYDTLSVDDRASEIIDGYYHTYTEGKIRSEKDGIITVDQHDRGVVEDYVRALGNYLDVSFKYDNTPTLQGYLTFDITEDSWSSLPSYMYGSDLKDQYGYTRIGGYLVFLYRDYEDVYNYETNDYQRVYGDWFYYKNYDNTVTGEYSYEKIVVNGADVIWPEEIKHVTYYAEPFITFPDGSSFYFEDFFDEISFKQLIDDYNGILDSYLNITGQN